MGTADTTQEPFDQQSKLLEEASVKYKRVPDMQKAPIKFKDAAGRKFSSSWYLCKTWTGMESLIKQAFVRVDVLEHHVQEGHYDLMNPDSEIILPVAWDATVEPGWEVSMHMWPIPETPKNMKEKKPEPEPEDEIVMNLDDNTIIDDVFAGMNLNDFVRTEAAQVQSVKKNKSKFSKAKAAKRNSEHVEVPLPRMAPPPMPPPVPTQPFSEHGEAPFPIIVDVDEASRARKSMKRKPKLSEFAAWMAGQQSGALRSLPQYASPYALHIYSLIPCMPHLEALSSFARNPERGPVITRLDYKHNIDDPRQKSRRTFSDEAWLEHDWKAFAKKLSSGGTSSASLRVLFVEDLTAALINKLGDLYGVDPELFAAHLSSAGGSGLSYDDLPVARWSTAKMRKSYYSLKWYRAVRLEEKVSQWLRSPKNMAKLDGEGIQWTETTYERRGKAVHETKTHHSVKLDKNIFRRSWPLSSISDGISGSGLHAAWEEKASVFMSSKEGLTTSKWLLQ